MDQFSLELTVDAGQVDIHQRSPRKTVQGETGELTPTPPAKWRSVSPNSAN